jgi:N-acetylmuramoyl-L-alanine amidase
VCKETKRSPRAMLAMARRLADKLRTLGFEVTLTRTDDRYLKLEERTAMANMARGDLFVSLHTNANPRRDRSGVETYFLNVTDDRYARRLAARENGSLAMEEAPRDVQRILTDLDSKASAGASRTLARMVQKEITSRTRQSQGAVNDRGVKNALFYVLLGARMPAVLVETAFISNRAEEKRLASPAYQQLVADGVARAVTEFAGQNRLAAR